MSDAPAAACLTQLRGIAGWWGKGHRAHAQHLSPMPFTPPIRRRSARHEFDGKLAAIHRVDERLVIGFRLVGIGASEAG